MNQCIIFLQGLPGSGKSTYAINRCKGDPKIKRLNKDSIRDFMGNPKFSRDFEKLVLEIQRKAGNFLLDAGYSIIIDDTNFSKGHLSYWLGVASERSIEFMVQTFNTSLEECIDRDSKREKPVGKQVILDMYEKYLKK
jgi:predicted kinase